MRPVNTAANTVGLGLDKAGGDGMTHRRNVLGLMVGGVSALALAGCGPLRRAKLRYRLTVEVDTPEGVKTGSTDRKSVV